MARYVETERFRRGLAKLSPEDRKKARRALEKLGEDPPRPSLNLEKLQGHEALWSGRVDRGHRLILRLGEDEEGDLFFVEDIGPHDVYRKWDRR